MTVQTQNSSQSFAGGQSVLTFNFRTLVSNPNYVQVTVLSSGTTVPLVYNVGYTVSVNSSGVGGTVTVTPTYSSACTYIVYRKTSILQGSAYSDYNQFPASTLENNLDQLTMIEQETGTNSQIVLSYPVGTSPSYSTTFPLPSYGTFIGGDPTSTFFINSLGTPGPQGATGPSGSTGSVSLVSSSTSDITVVSTSTTPIITSVNAVTSGVSTIIKTGADGYLHVSYPYIKITNTQASGTGGGQATTGSFQTLPLNTKDSDTANIAVLVTGTSTSITLPLGVYLVRASTPFFETGNTQIRLIAATGSTVLINGQCMNASNSADVGNISTLSGVITLTGSTVVVLQYRVASTVGANDLGIPCSYGTEVYTILEFEKRS